MDPNQPQPYPAQYQQPTPVAPSSEAWQITKIVFMVLSMIFCIVVLGISIAAAVNPDILSYVFVWSTPQAVVALIWSVAELITICARKGHQGIHPGAHVALHLLLWLGFSIGAALTAYSLAFVLIYTSNYSDYSYYYDDDYYYDYYGGTYPGLLQALVAFLALLVIIHFFLFVRACVETAQRNRVQTPVFVMPPQMYYGPPTQSPYPTQQPMQPGYPSQPQEAHLSGYYQQPGEVQNKVTDSSGGHVSQPTGTAAIYGDGLHPASP